MSLEINQSKLVEDNFSDVDSCAIVLQGKLVQAQRRGLTATISAIFLLATCAFAFHLPALQVLCPVAVFLMIRYLDHLRKSNLTFDFVSKRLTAETLRVMLAARDKPALIELIFSTRSFSTHPVSDACAQACGVSIASLQEGARSEATSESKKDYWKTWLDEQASYYAHASTRERKRGRQGTMVFNSAFATVALIGIGTCIWNLFDPVASRSDVFRAFMAVASMIGSGGLAYINFVKDRKAFDQSFDYDHMHRVLSGNANRQARTLKVEEFERLVVAETMNEHMRWALRMAGHFYAIPR